VQVASAVEPVPIYIGITHFYVLFFIQQGERTFAQSNTSFLR
jgi:hypothetical protein